MKTWTWWGCLINNTSYPDTQNTNFVLFELLTYILRQPQTGFLCVCVYVCMRMYYGYYDKAKNF